MQKLALFSILIFPAIAAAQSKASENEIYSTHFWLQSAANEVAKIKTPADQMIAYLTLSSRAADVGDVAVAEICAAAVEKLRAADATLRVAEEPSRFVTRAKIVSFGLQGKSEAALAMMGSDSSNVHEFVTALAVGHQVDALRALALDKSRPKELSAACVNAFLEEAILALDKSAATAALDMLPDQKNRDYLLSPKIQIFRLDGLTDSARARFVVELMQDTPFRGDQASQTSRNLSKRGFTKDALALAQLVPVMGRRAEAFMDICRALAKEGNAAEARKIIEKEEDNKYVALSARWGLALGLADRGEAEAAQLAYNAVKKDLGPAADFEAAMATGAILHGDFKAGLATLQTFAEKDKEKVKEREDLRNRAMSECVSELIKLKRIDDAAQLAAIYPESPFYALTNKGMMFFNIAKAYKDAKNDAGFTKAVKSLDALPPAAPEKNKAEAIANLARVHAMLGQADEALKFAGTLETPVSRDQARVTVASMLGTVGDFKNAARVLDSLENKPKGTGYIHNYTQVCTLAFNNGYLADVPAWIATWPDAEARAHGYWVMTTNVQRWVYENSLKKTK